MPARYGSLLEPHPLSEIPYNGNDGVFTSQTGKVSLPRRKDGYVMMSTLANSDDLKTVIKNGSVVQDYSKVWVTIAEEIKLAVQERYSLMVGALESVK
eukprot:Nk52_evm1s2075 gene=Nk52_evmTU1s2075